MWDELLNNMKSVLTAQRGNYSIIIDKTCISCKCIYIFVKVIIAGSKDFHYNPLT